MKKFTAAFFLFITAFPIFAQPRTPLFYKLSTTETAASSIPSNSITDIVVSGDTIWLGTGRGLSRSVDGGKNWKNYFHTAEFGNDDISAIAVHNKEVWVATAHTVKANDQSLPEGTGIHFSSDGGKTWKKFPQPVDTYNVDTIFWNSKSRIRVLGITTAITNITYDIAVTNSDVWICSYAGMARRYSKTDSTWHVVVLPPDNLNSIGPDDSLIFDLSPSGGALGLQNNLNHRAFSVFAENDSVIWIGTAGGINKTTDHGKSWTKFSKQNQTNPISGNFVVAIGKQQTDEKNIIWAATVNAADVTEERGISLSEDGGFSWKQTLLGEFVHNLGFKKSIAYAVSDNGIFRSADFGNSWTQAGTIYDNSTKQFYTSPKFYAVASKNDSIWFGGNDGVVISIDDENHYFGGNWIILHSSQPLSSATTTYAYPNPFSPDDEVVRIHYSTGGIDAPVTIRIFDFGMNLVRTLIQHAVRNGIQEHDEIWNGKSDNGMSVVNGVYFYNIAIDNKEPFWGKILVIQ